MDAPWVICASYTIGGKTTYRLCRTRYANEPFRESRTEWDSAVFGTEAAARAYAAILNASEE